MPDAVDFGKTARDYARHRAGFPEAFFDRLSVFGIGRTGQRVLDLGTGTGTVARQLARRGCVVTGLDKSPSLIEEAKRLDAVEGVKINYALAPAEQTGFGKASIDVATAGQCWHWFDRPRAAREVRRVLIDSGWLVIAHFDWLPLTANVVARTEVLIQRHNPAWTLGGGTGLYPEWLGDVRAAGFTGVETFSFDVEVPYSHQGWRGRIRASAGVGASLAADAVDRFDAELAKLLGEHFPTEPLLVPHRVWAMVCRSRPGG